MDRVQCSSLRMYVAVASTLQAAPDSLGVASLPAKLPQFLAKVAQIYELAALQTQTTRGKTARRDELSQEMIDLALDVAGAVAAHADEHKLTELACSVEVTAGTFKRMRIPHRPILAQQIHDIAQSVVADLAPNGVTAATLVKLQEHIALVKTWLDQPRSVIRAKSAATAQLAEVFRDADALLKRQIDRLVFLARKTHPEFYADYQRARQVPDYPGPRATQAGPGPAALPALAATSTATSATPAPEVPPDAHVASPESGQSSMTFDVTESEPACRRCVAQASRLPVRKQAGRLRYSKPSPASRLLQKTESCQRCSSYSEVQVSRKKAQEAQKFRSTAVQIFAPPASSCGQTFPNPVSESDALQRAARDAAYFAVQLNIHSFPKRSMRLPQ